MSETMEEFRLEQPHADPADDDARGWFGRWLDTLGVLGAEARKARVDARLRLLRMGIVASDRGYRRES